MRNRLPGQCRRYKYTYFLRLISDVNRKSSSCRITFVHFEILFRPTILAARENKLKVNSRFHFSYCYSYCVIRFVNKFYKNTVNTTVFELFANFQNIVLRIGVVLIHFKSTGLDNSLTTFFFAQALWTLLILFYLQNYPRPC